MLRGAQYKSNYMALLIKKTGLRTPSGLELKIGDGQNDGILVRFYPQGEFKGFGQSFTLGYYTTLDADLDKFGTTAVMYEYVEGDNTSYRQLTPQFFKPLTFEQIIQTYDLGKSLLPDVHPTVIVAWGYHYYVKQELEKYLGEKTVEIRLDLM